MTLGNRDEMRPATSKVVTSHEMREIEAEWFDSGEISEHELIEVVGRAIAGWTVANIGRPIALCNVVALAGRGSNGSDALAAATELANRGARATAILCLGQPKDHRWIDDARGAGVTVFDATAGDLSSDLIDVCTRSHIVLDGVLGYGVSRPIREPLPDLLRTVRGSARFIAAIDVPSGADPDTGNFDPNGLPADVTLSIGATKLGAALRDGRPEFGRRHHVLDIGIPATRTGYVNREVMTDAHASRLLPRRPATAHKGDLGRTLLVVGSRRYVGAAVLATRACARSSVGLLTTAVAPELKPTIATAVPEATFIDLRYDADGSLDYDHAHYELAPLIPGFDSVLIGCGIGVGDPQRRLLKRIFVPEVWQDTTAVLDADALTMLAEMGKSQVFGGGLIMTPHPGEMSRLLNKGSKSFVSVATVEDDRIRSALLAAKRYNAVTVLKGASTIVCDPSGRVRFNMRPNSALARGGTGDALAGLTAGLAAQMPCFDAASLAVYVHSLAGQYARDEIGEYGATASDVAMHIPDAFSHLASLRNLT